MNCAQRFLVVGMQRSGTTVTHQLVAGHPDIATNAREASAELFIDIGDSYFSTTKRLFPVHEEVGTQRPELVECYFDLAVRHGGDFDDKALRGLKVAVNRLDRTERMVESILRNMPDLKVILVARSNVVAAAMSAYLFARSHKHRLIHKVEDRGVYEPFELPAEFMANYVVKWRRTNTVLAKLLNLETAMEVHYEQDIEGKRLLDGKALFEFLRVKPVSVDWLTLKKNLSPPAELLTNFDEVKTLADHVTALVDSGCNDDEILRPYRPRPGIRAFMQNIRAKASGALNSLRPSG